MRWHTNIVGGYIRTLPSGQIFWNRPPPTEGFHRNVPIITLDQYILDNQLDSVDILHSDIQGEEYNMLLGAKNALKNKKIGVIFVSTHNDKVHALCLENLMKQRVHMLIQMHNN